MVNPCSIIQDTETSASAPAASNTPSDRAPTTPQRTDWRMVSDEMMFIWFNINNDSEFIWCIWNYMVYKPLLMFHMENILYVVYMI